MKLFYRVNDYHPFDIKDSSAASSVRHRVDRVCRCLPDATKSIIYSIVKEKNVLLIKRDVNNNENNQQCITYFVPSNPLGILIKIFLSLCLMIYLLFKTVKKENYLLIYNLLPVHIFPYLIASYIYPSFLKKTIFQVEELYSMYNFSFIKNLLNLHSEKFVFRNGLNFIVVNENVKKIIKQKKAKSIVDYGYNTRNSKAYNKLSVSDAIVYTGRLDYVGGVEVLLEAISNLPSDIRNKFVITGYGGLKEQVVAHANELNIKFKGFLSEADYDSLLSSAKISINPLRSKCNFSLYSFPSKVLQYLEYGCVVISSGIEQPELEYYFSDELFSYKNDDARTLSMLIMEINSRNFDKVKIIDKYHVFMKNKEKKLRAFFLSVFEG